MGAGVSNWRLAQAVSRQGQLGVVSGTALDVILRGGCRTATRAATCAAPGRLPVPGMAERVLASTSSRAAGPGRALPGAADVRHRLGARAVDASSRTSWRCGSHARATTNRSASTCSTRSSCPSCRRSTARCWRASVRADGRRHPDEVPGVLDRLAPRAGESACMSSIEGDDTAMRFSPADWTRARPPRSGGRVSAIIASNARADLPRKANGRVDGFIVEGPTAGGHNAPPRGKPALKATGSRCTASATSWTSRRCANWACRSGWPAGAARPRVCGTRSPAGPPASRWERPSRSATSRAWTPRQGAVLARTDGRCPGLHRPRRLAHRLSVQGGRAGGDDVVRGRIPARTRICDLGYLRELTDGRTARRLPLPGGARHPVRHEGRRRSEGRAASASATPSWPTSAFRKRGAASPRRRS